MARIRQVKPEFFDDADIGALAPLARLLFVGLWTEADREGRLVDDERRLKVRLLPYDDVAVGQLLEDLAAASMIVRYSVDGRRYIQIRSFLRHQHPHVKEPPSTIPACVNGNAQGETGASTVPAPGLHQASTGLAPVEHQPCPLGSGVLSSGVRSTGDSPLPDAGSGPSGFALADPGQPSRKAAYRAVVDRYFERFSRATNVERPKFTAGDGKLVKSLLASHGTDTVLAALDRMFNSSEAFVRQSGYSIGFFSSQFNRWLVGMHRAGKAPPPKLGLWGEVLERLATRLERRTLNQWFVPLVVVREARDSIVLRPPDASAAAFIARHYRADLAAACAEVGEGLAVHIEDQTQAVA